MEVCNTIQEAMVTKTILKKKKCKKAKWLSEEELQIAEKRGEAKVKGEREKYTQYEAEFQRIARRHKKTLLSEQCKEIKENNTNKEFLQYFKQFLSEALSSKSWRCLTLWIHYGCLAELEILPHESSSPISSKPSPSLLLTGNLLQLEKIQKET